MGCRTQHGGIKLIDISHAFGYSSQAAIADVSRLGYTFHMFMSSKKKNIQKKAWQNKDLLFFLTCSWPPSFPPNGGSTRVTPSYSTDFWNFVSRRIGSKFRFKDTIESIRRVNFAWRTNWNWPRFVQFLSREQILSEINSRRFQHIFKTYRRLKWFHQRWLGGKLRRN